MCIKIVNTALRMSTVEIELTENEKELLAKQDKRIISNFEATRLEKDARKNWDKFYMRNTTNFFKDRHWTEREFKELNPSSWPDQKYTICESGCGVGNFIFPLLEEHSNIVAFACDFSQRAVDFVATRAEEQNLSDRLTAFQCDLTDVPLDDKIDSKCDLVTMIFVLSAIHPSKFVTALKNLTSLLTNGGKLLFRDYAVNDHAMIRFKPGSKVNITHVL